MYRGIKMKEQLEKIYSDAVADIERYQIQIFEPKG